MGVALKDRAASGPQPCDGQGCEPDEYQRKRSGCGRQRRVDAYPRATDVRIEVARKAGRGIYAPSRKELISCTNCKELMPTPIP